ncbi:hypothetical protein ScPMuIL_017683 [Solemya velum]
MSFVNKLNLRSLLKNNVLKTTEPRQKFRTEHNVEQDSRSPVSEVVESASEETHSPISGKKSYKKDGRKWLHKSRSKTERNKSNGDDDTENSNSCDQTACSTRIVTSLTDRNITSFSYEDEEASREAFSDLDLQSAPDSLSQTDDSQTNRRTPDSNISGFGEPDVSEESLPRKQLYEPPPDVMTVGGKTIPTVALRAGMERAFGGMIKNYLIGSYGLDPKVELEKGFRVKHTPNADKNSMSGDEKDPDVALVVDTSSSNSSNSSSSELVDLLPASPKRIRLSANGEQSRVSFCSLGIPRSTTPTPRSLSPWECTAFEEMTENSRGFPATPSPGQDAAPDLSHTENTTRSGKRKHD